MRWTFVVLAVVLAACSSGGSNTSGTTTSGETSSPATLSSATSSSGAVSDSTSHDLEVAVRAYSAAYLSGDGDTAYRMLSARCRNRVAHDQFVGEVSQAKKLYGTAEMQTFSIDQSSGGLARVTYTYDQPAINQVSEPWVLEDGSWHEDDC
jgi:hypothetical protein